MPVPAWVIPTVISVGSSLLGSLFKRKPAERTPTAPQWAENLGQYASQYAQGSFPVGSQIYNKAGQYLLEQIGKTPEEWEWVKNQIMGTGGGGNGGGGGSSVSAISPTQENWLAYYKNIIPQWQKDVGSARTAITPFLSTEGWMRDITPILEEEKARAIEEMRRQGLSASSIMGEQLANRLAKVRLSELGRAQEGVLKAASMMPSLFAPMSDYMSRLAGIELQDVESRRRAEEASAMARAMEERAKLETMLRLGQLKNATIMQQLGMAGEYSGMPYQWTTGLLRSAMPTQPQTYQPSAGENFLNNLMNIGSNVFSVYGLGKQQGWW